MLTPLSSLLSLGGCGSGDVPRPIEVVQTELFSTNAFTSRDWPGVAPGDGRFRVLERTDAGAGSEADLCRNVEVDGAGDWRCPLGPRAGVVEVIDDRLAAVPGLEPLHVFAEIAALGDSKEAYVSPMAHLVAELALHLNETRMVALPAALAEASDRVRPLVFDARELLASPVSGARTLRTDSERQALVLEALTQISARQYGALPFFHKTRRLTVALAQTVRETGALRDTVLETAQGDVAVSRELFRHDLAVEVLAVAAAKNVPEATAREWAEAINRQSGLLFEFTSAPALPPP